MNAIVSALNTLAPVAAVPPLTVDVVPPLVDDINAVEAGVLAVEVQATASVVARQLQAGVA